jgi:hypothetical protein
MINPLLKDAMKRAGEKVPENGVVIMSNGQAIDCSLEKGDTNWTNRFRDARGTPTDAASKVSHLASDVTDPKVKSQLQKADGLIGSARQILFNLQ